MSSERSPSPQTETARKGGSKNVDAHSLTDCGSPLRQSPCAESSLCKRKAHLQPLWITMGPCLGKEGGGDTIRAPYSFFIKDFIFKVISRTLRSKVARSTDWASRVPPRTPYSKWGTSEASWNGTLNPSYTLCFLMLYRFLWRVKYCFGYTQFWLLLIFSGICTEKGSNVSDRNKVWFRWLVLQWRPILAIRVDGEEGL